MASVERLCFASMGKAITFHFYVPLRRLSVSHISEHEALKCCEQTENRMWEEKSVLQPETGIITVSCTQRCSLTALLLIKSQEVSDVLFDSPAHASDTAVGTAGKTWESLCFLARVSSEEDNDSNLWWPRPVIPHHPSFSIFHLQFRQKQEKKTSGM